VTLNVAFFAMGSVSAMSASSKVTEQRKYWTI
jgi:hypothetical protein